MAIDKVGDVWAEMHIRTDRVDDDIASGLQGAGKDADKEATDIGKSLGDSLTDAMGKQIEANGPELAGTIGRSVEKELGKEKVDFEPDWRYNRRGKNGQFISRLADDMVDEVEEAFEGATRKGGVFSKIGTAIADAIGSGFNVSGRSPLIALFAFVIPAIIDLVLGAIQAVNALIALLTTVPALLLAIGAQAGVLVLAFQGVGTAIQGAFAATNAKELNEALKGLAPSAQNFVRSLLPLRDFFSDLQNQVQQGFFAAFGNTITRVVDALKASPRLIAGFVNLAGTLGGLLNTLGSGFGEPKFLDFLNKVVLATQMWLSELGPALKTLGEGFTDLGIAALPMLYELGRIVNAILITFGELLSDVAKDPAFQLWLSDMTTTLYLLGDLVWEVGRFIVVLMDSLNKAGANQIFDALIEAISYLSAFFASDIGISALEGLIALGIYAIQILTGLIIFIGLVIGAFKELAAWITGTAIPAIGDALEWFGARVKEFFDWIEGPMLTGIGNFFVTIYQFIFNVLSAIGEFLVGLGTKIAQFIGWVWNIGVSIDTFFRKTVPDAVANFIANLVRSLNDARRGVEQFFFSLPGLVGSVFSGAGNWLYGAGKALIQGLINGIRSMFGPLEWAMSRAADILARFLPGSPAEEGPLSGKGYSLYRGQALVEDFAKGMQMESSTLSKVANNTMSNIVFGANSIQMTFTGPVPGQQTAQSIGMAVGNGILSQLATRDTRLAVRSM